MQYMNAYLKQTHSSQTSFPNSPQQRLLSGKLALFLEVASKKLTTAETLQEKVEQINSQRGNQFLEPTKGVRQDERKSSCSIQVLHIVWL